MYRLTFAKGALLSLCLAVLMPAANAVAEDPLAPHLWEKRPVIIFADSPRDPRFQRQMESLTADAAAMEERDVVIYTDTDPSVLSPLRKRFRPRDFQILLIGKDGEIKLRRPSPITGEDLNRQIDRMPMRLREIEEEKG